MLVRVRGAGASAANSQAVVMGLRGATMNAKARAASEYPMQPRDIELSSDGEAAQPQPHPDQQRAAASLLWVLDRYHVFPMVVDDGGATRGAVWREVHNLYDIAFDEDDDADADNAIGSVALRRLATGATLSATPPPSHRRLLPLHAFAAASGVLMSAAADAADDRTLELVLTVPAEGTGEAPASWASIATRRALTALAFACWQFPALAAGKLSVVLGDDAVGTAYEGVVAAAWAVATGRLPNATTERSREDCARQLGSLVAELTKPDLARVPFRVIAASEYVARVPNGDRVIITVDDALAAAVSANPRDAQVVNAAPWIAGEAADDDGPRFDLSAATAERMREGARENFCPCCGHCSAGGNDSAAA